MIRTIIIDDEYNNVVALRKSLDIYCLDVEIVAEADCVEAGFEAINKHQPDLIFLDIEMPDGTGFDLLKKFEKVNFHVVFVTAFNQYAIKAFQFSAIDYILKPINVELLIKAVHKVSNKPADIEKRIKSLFENREKIKTVALPTFEGIQVEKVENILYCKSENNYTIFFLKGGGGKIMVSKTLKEYDEILSDYNFLRVHQSYLINLAEVKRYVKGEGGYVILSNDDSVDVSRRRKQAFLDAVNQ